VTVKKENQDVDTSSYHCKWVWLIFLPHLVLCLYMVHTCS